MRSADADVLMRSAKYFANMCYAAPEDLGNRRQAASIFRNRRKPRLYLAVSAIFSPRLYLALD